MITIRVQRIGDEVGVILPPDMLAKLHVLEGDSLRVTEVPSGFVICSHSPRAARQLEVALEGMDRFAPALQELAK
jgi:antitoxin component of MazEF toxin-antitoxin module